MEGFKKKTTKKNSNNGNDKDKTKVKTKTRRRGHSASANDNNKINGFNNMSGTAVVMKETMKKQANIENRTKIWQVSTGGG